MPTLQDAGSIPATSMNRPPDCLFGGRFFFVRELNVSERRERLSPAIRRRRYRQAQGFESALNTSLLSYDPCSMTFLIDMCVDIRTSIGCSATIITEVCPESISIAPSRFSRSLPLEPQEDGAVFPGLNTAAPDATYARQSLRPRPVKSEF